MRKNWLSSRTTNNALWTWRSLERAKSILKEGACLTIGNSNNILVWEDPWIPDNPQFRPNPKDEASNSNSLVVAQLLNHEGLCWDVEKLQSLFDQETVKAIRRIPICPHSQDKWYGQNLIMGRC